MVLDDPTGILTDKLTQLDPIRQSHTIAKRKEVILLTPVLITDSDLMSPYLPMKLAYQLGDRLNQLAPPGVEQPHAGGLIIQIPQDEPELYLDRVLSLKALATDDELVENLERILRSSRHKP